ncbi:MAG TPA: Rho termination factor N-terminal domain-containing protein [Solirubrobacteraceae bacterium]
MSVLDRDSLEQSPLADLHAIASELSLDGYRRLRKDELIDAILERQGGEGGASAEADQEESSKGRRRGRRGGRGRGSKQAEASDEEAGPDAEGPEEAEQERDRVEEDADKPRRSRRGAQEQPVEEIVEGVVELLPNGSGFLRLAPPEPSDDDVYVSAAQVRRCELVSGDRVAGPRRAPRRSERFASLVRVDMINGQPAAEVADTARYDDLPAVFPGERLPLDSDDLTINAITGLAPIGMGSRVTIAGAAQSGKSEVLRRLTGLLAGNDQLQVWLVLVGVRPEEVGEWRGGPVEPAVALTLSASADAQGQAVEGVVEQARRIAARGANTVVLIDTLEVVPLHASRRAMASARKLADGGSLTVIATAPEPIGGETTVIAMDAALARTGQFPALDPAGTWTMRRDALEE